MNTVASTFNFLGNSALCVGAAATLSGLYMAGNIPQALDRFERETGGSSSDFMIRGTVGLAFLALPVGATFGFGSASFLVGIGFKAVAWSCGSQKEEDNKENQSDKKELPQCKPSTAIFSLWNALGPNQQVALGGLAFLGVFALACCPFILEPTCIRLSDLKGRASI